MTEIQPKQTSSSFTLVSVGVLIGICLTLTLLPLCCYSGFFGLGVLSAFTSYEGEYDYGVDEEPQITTGSLSYKVGGANISFLYPIEFRADYFLDDDYEPVFFVTSVDEVEVVEDLEQDGFFLQFSVIELDEGMVDSYDLALEIMMEYEKEMVSENSGLTVEEILEGRIQGESAFEVEYSDDYQAYSFISSGKRILWAYSDTQIIEIQISVGINSVDDFEDEIDLILESIIVRQQK